MLRKIQCFTHAYVSSRPSWLVSGAISALSNVVFIFFCFKKLNEMKKPKTFCVTRKRKKQKTMRKNGKLKEKKTKLKNKTEYVNKKMKRK